MTNGRPKRKAVCMASKRIATARQNGICECGCGTPIWTGKRCNIQWDHMPALRLRDVRPDGKDYIPAQQDPAYIVARCRASHAAKTHGTGATTAGSDTGRIKKERKRAKPKREYRWNSRPMQSRGFDKRHKPMRRKK